MIGKKKAKVSRFFRVGKVNEIVRVFVVGRTILS